MPCCSANRSQRSSAITSIRLETERFSKDVHLFQFVSLLLTHRQVELRFVLVLFGFCHSQFFTLRSSQPMTQSEKFTLKRYRRKICFRHALYLHIKGGCHER